MYLEIFNKQRAFFNTLVTYEYSYRIRMLKKLKAMILDNIDLISDALYQDLKKSPTEAYMTEIGLVLNNITYTLKNLKRWMKKRRTKTQVANFLSKSYVLSDPRGVCLIMSPWNYPFLLAIDPLVGAIAGGNTAILKMSSHSINTSKLLERLINQTFSDEYIKAFLISGAETDNLLKLHFDFIFFTGSKKIGMHVLEMASPNLIPVCLELGGKSPCIVTKNAKLDITARRIAFGKVTNAGQTCVAPDFICVDASIKQEFIKKLKLELVKMLGNTPLDNPSYPCIISSFHKDRLMKLIDGSDVVFGGLANEEKIEPTIIDNVSFDDPIMQEEIFGPLIPIIEYSSLDALKEKIKHMPLPLAFYIFSSNAKEQEEITRYFRFGGGCINDTLMHLVSETLPFGGVGYSGMGKYHGKYTFDTFTVKKGILKKSTKIDISLRYHPYNKKKERIIKKVLK